MMIISFELHKAGREVELAERALRDAEESYDVDRGPLPGRLVRKFQAAEARLANARAQLRKLQNAGVRRTHGKAAKTSRIPLDADEDRVGGPGRWRDGVKASQPEGK
jgi:hypothetical protein